MRVRPNQVLHRILDGAQRLLDRIPGLSCERLGLGIFDGPVEDEGIVCR